MDIRDVLSLKEEDVDKIDSKQLPLVKETLARYIEESTNLLETVRKQKEAVLKLQGMTAENLAFVKGQVKGVEKDMGALEAGDMDLQNYIDDLRARVGKIRVSKTDLPSAADYASIVQELKEANEYADVVNAELDVEIEAKRKQLAEVIEIKRIHKEALAESDRIKAEAERDRIRKENQKEIERIQKEKEEHAKVEAERIQKEKEERVKAEAQAAERVRIQEDKLKIERAKEDQKKAERAKAEAKTAERVRIQEEKAQADRAKSEAQTAERVRIQKSAEPTNTVPKKTPRKTPQKKYDFTLNDTLEYDPDEDDF